MYVTYYLFIYITTLILAATESKEKTEIWKYQNQDLLNAIKIYDIWNDIITLQEIISIKGTHFGHFLI